MDSSPASTISPPDSPEALLQSFGRTGDRGRSLRAQLAARFAARSEEEIEDAVQTACRCFLDEAQGIADPGQAFAWLRTAAHRALLRELNHRDREVAVDPAELGADETLIEESGPAEELIALEDEADLGLLVGELADSLSGRRREILALWGAGHNRPEIASELGVSERSVKRDLLAIMEEARVILASEAGGGCMRGEPLVLRLAYGLASCAEAAQARVHLDRCRRCADLSSKLEVWREKAGALLPLPAVEAASSGLMERIAHRGVDAIGSLKQQVLGGAQAKQQAALGACSRAVDPTPLAGVRPGPLVAVVAGCLAIGGGATYCAQQGVDPLSAATGLIAGGSDMSEPEPSSEPPEATEPSAVAPPPVSYQPSEGEPGPIPSPAEPTPAPEPKPQPEPEPAPPPPEASFEPSAPVSSSASTGEVSEPATESAPPVAPQPAPVPANSAPQFGGP